MKINFTSGILHEENKLTGMRRALERENDWVFIEQLIFQKKIIIFDGTCKDSKLSIQFLREKIKDNEKK